MKGWTAYAAKSLWSPLLRAKVDILGRDTGRRAMPGWDTAASLDELRGVGVPAALAILAWTMPSRWAAADLAVAPQRSKCLALA